MKTLTRLLEEEPNLTLWGLALRILWRVLVLWLGISFAAGFLIEVIRNLVSVHHVPMILM
jgi:hypothetical protein